MITLRQDGLQKVDAPLRRVTVDIVDGLLTTRLTAAIAPAATVDEVNAALETQGARIVSMNRLSPFVTLKIPAASDPAAAGAVADALVATGAFLYAAPARAVEVATVVDGMQPANTYRVGFETTNLANGVYLYRLETPKTVLTRQMIVLK